LNEESEERENAEEESYDVEIVNESYEDEMEEDYESLVSDNEENKQTIEQHQSPSEGTAQFPGS
jgi:hypothetical protein